MERAGRLLLQVLSDDGLQLLAEVLGVVPRQEVGLGLTDRRPTQHRVS